MNRTILTTALVAIATLTSATAVFADHSAVYRRNFEANRLRLTHEYEAKRNANKHAYHHQRDALHAARRVANRIDCRDTRAIRVRAINRDLSALSRDYHLRNREITSWFHNERDALRTAYEVALRNARRVSSRPVVVETVAAHPADCSCNVCVPVVEEVVIERPSVYERPVFERPTVYGQSTIVERYGRPVVVERAPNYRHPADCDCHICEPPPTICPSRSNFDRRDSFDRYRDGRNRDFYNSYSPARSSGGLDLASLIFNLIN